MSPDTVHAIVATSATVDEPVVLVLVVVPDVDVEVDVEVEVEVAFGDVVPEVVPLVREPSVEVV